MTRRIIAGLLVWGALVVGALVWVSPAQASCRMTAREWYNPSGWEGCTRYGVGIASRWQGPGAARNDCLYPWDRCTPIRIQSLSTGLSIIVIPTMFCDCYTNSPAQRLVDLDAGMLRALGLDPAAGLWPVEVLPAGAAGLPDTAMQP